MTGYVAEEVDYAIIDVDDDALPPSALGVPAMGLALRLRVWNDVNGTEARLVEAHLPYEPAEDTLDRARGARPASPPAS